MTRIPFAIIIPAYAEAEVLETVIREWKPVAAKFGGLISVGLNGEPDDSLNLLRSLEVIAGQTSKKGYGHGCVAAITRLNELDYLADAYIFVAADGANDASELSLLLHTAQQSESDLVLGQRTRLPGNFKSMGFFQWISNRLLGFACLAICGRMFCDLGPFRFMRRDFYEKLAPRELQYGFTIESQVYAVLSGARIAECDVTERPRIAGVQKVSGGSLMHRWRICRAILVGGAKTRARWKKNAASSKL